MLTEDFTGSALNIPDYKLVMEAMEKDYDMATTEEKMAMKFFLNTVMPCVDPEVMHKIGSQEGKTHLEIFRDCWHSEMATGLLVLKEYSRADIAAWPWTRAVGCCWPTTWAIPSGG